MQLALKYTRKSGNSSHRLDLKMEDLYEKYYCRFAKEPWVTFHDFLQLEKGFDVCIMRNCGRNRIEKLEIKADEYARRFNTENTVVCSVKSAKNAKKSKRIKVM